ncbi:glycoside hydrolase family 20 protein [Viridothelium virens]|uniref:Beta-hexosaminidase n=1 Tax=Viridothelium virens TaxID=1048519 RepID=A0A6A6GYU7_VIRVR|nr:glycoside hydrolase family 20 protein [Viridothelium virens]
MRLTLIVITLFSATIEATLPLWPLPRHLKSGSSTLWMARDVKFSYLSKSNLQNFVGWFWDQVQFPHFESTGDGRHTPAAKRNLAHRAFERMQKRVFEQNLVPSKFNPRGLSFEPSYNVTSALFVKSVDIIEVSSLVHEAIADDIADEAYTIDVNPAGNCRIQVVTIQGAIYALETFAQLFFAHSYFPDVVYLPFAPINIVDGPRFRHRGLNLDISRNQFTSEDVMRTIEAMSSSKFNKLHLHAIDSQSWPIEVPALPKLAREGAYEPVQVLSVTDLKEIQKFGSVRGIEVYLEIDMPGHTTSIGKAYPNLITAPNEPKWQDYALEPPSGQLRLNSSDVYEFVTTLLRDLLPRLEPYTSLFHLGGDELNKNAYNLDPTVNSSSKEVLRPLVQSFVNHAIKSTARYGFTPLLWEEMVLDWNLTLPKNTIIQTWRSTSSLSDVVFRGHKALFGSNSHWYLDCGHGVFLDPADPSRPSSDPMLHPPYEDYCSPYKNWRQVYSYDPLAGMPTSSQDLVIGGEMHLWSELTDSVTLDGMLWPRAAAAAEVMWRGSGARPTEDTTRRLAFLRERLVARDIAAGMVTMEWCLRNQGGCVI